MRYFTTILSGQSKGAEREPIDVEDIGNGRFRVTWRGATHEIDALALPHGAVSFLSDGASHSVEFEESEDAIAVLVRGQVVKVDIADERKLRMRAAGGKFSVEGKQTIVAPMPGKVVRVLVKPGDEVAEGAGLVVVEAMKMENELKSPKAGKVTELLVKEGQAVEANAKLVVVE
ncbi:MAG: biotin/lipoyl-containing protein [Myxococcales bacterium]